MSPVPASAPADATDEPTDGRPGGCECSGGDLERLPCWYCYAVGFETPHPDAGDDESAEEGR